MQYPHTYLPLASVCFFPFASALHLECGFCLFWLRLCSEFLWIQMLMASSSGGMVHGDIFLPIAVCIVFFDKALCRIPYHSIYFFYLCLWLLPWTTIRRLSLSTRTFPSSFLFHGCPCYHPNY
ncbi:hypothetical protein BJ912DRAFT_662516 [Pholiota molesta]|nr:hypothetical protein BJ912DRAFT_662516 [Pholiota molesta]